MLTKTKQASITNISRCVEHVSRKSHFQLHDRATCTHTMHIMFLMWYNYIIAFYFHNALGEFIGLQTQLLLDYW